MRLSFILGECAYASALPLCAWILAQSLVMGKIMQGLGLQFSVFQRTCIVLCGIYVAVSHTASFALLPF